MSYSPPSSARTTRPAIVVTNVSRIAVGAFHVELAGTYADDFLVQGLTDAHDDGWVLVEDLEPGDTALVWLDESKNGSGGTLRLRWTAQTVHGDREGLLKVEVPDRHPPFMAAVY